MTKQTELRGLLDKYAQQVRAHAESFFQIGAAHIERSAWRSMREAENRIFSFFDQMRQTIDGLNRDIIDMIAQAKKLTHERDEAVKASCGLVDELRLAQRELNLRREELAAARKGSELEFVPFDPARKDEGLEVLIGDPTTGTWYACEYVGKTSTGIHVVMVVGRGIVAVVDSAVGLRHRAEPKTVTMYANLYRNDGRLMGFIYEGEDIARQQADVGSLTTAQPVQVKLPVAK